MTPEELGPEHRREEFARLFQEHERSVYGYILSLVPNIAAADEISQNTSLLLWEEFDRFAPNTDFRAWARTIAYYEVLSYRKKAGRERVRFDSELLDVLADRAAVRCDDLASRQSHLIDCLAQLSEFKRQVVQLYCVLGMTIKTVAEKLGRNASTVEKTLARTRRSLYDCVEKAMRREERA